MTRFKLIRSYLHTYIMTHIQVQQVVMLVLTSSSSGSLMDIITALTNSHYSIYTHDIISAGTGSDTSTFFNPV